MKVEIESTRSEKILAVVLLTLIVIWQRWSDFFVLLDGSF